jgi:hypothetical protein
VDKDCGDYSDDDLQRFFRAHPCISHYRTLIECAEENYVIRFSIATRKLSDYDTAIDLNALFSRGTAETSPSSNSGKCRNVLFIVGRTRGAKVLASLATDVLSSLLA